MNTKQMDTLFVGTVKNVTVLLQVVLSVWVCWQSALLYLRRPNSDKIQRDPLSLIV